MDFVYLAFPSSFLLFLPFHCTVASGDGDDIDDDFQHSIKKPIFMVDVVIFIILVVVDSSSNIMTS